MCRHCTLYTLCVPRAATRRQTNTKRQCGTLRQCCGWSPRGRTKPVCRYVLIPSQAVQRVCVLLFPRCLADCFGRIYTRAHSPSCPIPVIHACSLTILPYPCNTCVLTHHPALYTRAHSPSCPIPVIHACSLTILPYPCNTHVLTHHPALYTRAHSPSYPIPVGSKAAAEVEQEEGLLQDPEHQPQCHSG